MQEEKDIFLLCQKGGLHQFKNLNMVCINKNCIQKLICTECFLESHENHEVMSLKHLNVTILKEFKDLQKTKNFSKFKYDIDLNKEKFLKEFDFFKENIMKKLALYKNSVENTFDSLKDFAKNFTFDEKEVERKFEILYGKKEFNDINGINKILDEILNKSQENKFFKFNKDFYLEEKLGLHQNNVIFAKNQLSNEILDFFKTQESEIIFNQVQNLIKTLKSYFIILNFKILKKGSYESEIIEIELKEKDIRWEFLENNKKINLKLGF